MTIHYLIMNFLCCLLPLLHCSCSLFQTNKRAGKRVSQIEKDDKAKEINFGLNAYGY